MACCKNKIGEFPHNRDIETGIVSTVTGLHELRFKASNFTRQSVWVNISVAGDEFVIPQGTLNENFTYSFEIVKPDGSLLSETDCTTFELTTYINTITCEDEQYL